MNIIESNTRMSVERAVRLFELLADEKRLRLLLYLADGQEVPVTTLAGAVGMSQPVASRHLSLLRLGGVVSLRREGKNYLYALAPGPVREILLRFVRP